MHTRDVQAFKPIYIIESLHPWDYPWHPHTHPSLWNLRILTLPLKHPYQPSFLPPMPHTYYLGLSLVNPYSFILT
jgi:hypothetical protein